MVKPVSTSTNAQLGRQRQTPTGHTPPRCDTMATAVSGSGRPAAPLEFCGSGKLKHLGGTVAATVFSASALFRKNFLVLIRSIIQMISWWAFSTQSLVVE